MKLNFYKLIFLLFCALNAIGQSNSIRFSQLSIKDGLSQSSVNQIIQDSKGYMWFATQDGLNKFDGYRFTVYKNDPLDSSSISDNFIHVVYEEPSGDFWVGTDEGLNFFDREKQRFTKFVHTADPKSISHNSVWGITRDKKGTLWIATAEGGLNRLDSVNGKPVFTAFKQGQSGLASNYLSSLFCDSQGNLWIATLGGGVSVLDENGKFKSYKHENKNGSLANDIVWNFFEDSKKNIWIGTNEGLSKYDPSKKSFQNFISDPKDPYSISGNTIRSIMEDPEGNIWIGTAGGGLNKLDVRGNFTWYKNLSYNSSSLIGNTVYSLFRDMQGVIWIGTDNGISRFDYFKQNFSHYQYISSNEKGISSNMIWSILSNKDQTLWLGTDNGLCLLNRRTQQYTEYGGIENTTEGENKRIYSLLYGKDGKLWVGTDNGVYQLNTANKKLIKTAASNKRSNELNSKRIYCIFEDRDENLWIGSKEGLLVLDAKRSAFLQFRNDENNETSLSNNVIRVIRQDAAGNIWIGTNGGGLNKVVFQKDRTITAENISFVHYRNTGRKNGSINNNIILSIYEDGETLWLGTYGGGLNKFNIASGKVEHYTDREGLSNNVIYSIIPDKAGNLWMSTNKGISRFELKSKTFRNYFENDGLQSNEFNIGAHHRSADGEIFMGGINGLNAFMPEKIRTNPIAPAVAITDFLIFNKSVKASNSFLKKDLSSTNHITLSYKQNSFSFEFSALHFSAPEKNSYAYMLEGLEDSWNYFDERHLATYTKLDPGTYVFKVKAANSDKIWSEKPVEVTITIKPPYWQTWWFRIALAVLILAIVYGWYRARIKNIEEQKKVLEQLVAIRTAEIQHHMEEVEVQKTLVEKEKEKVEKLLLNILPEDTAEELKTKGKAEARHYRLASVMFTDFKGFTQIAESMRPKDLVAELDRYFIEFDQIIEKYGIEKIKTIGDSYMCAGGLPIRNKSNPIDIILAGLEIQRYMRNDIEEKIAKNENHWELRIGIHTGELIAGVVGTKRFAYDIWGDTVNVANRMESSGAEGKVNISGTTYELASEFFVCTYRGQVKAKNKGEIDMYFVEAIRPELSENGEGIVPNELFQRKMSHVLYSKIQYKKAEQFILKLLSEKLPEGLFYHGLHHTMDVCDAVEKLAFLEGVEGEDVFLLKTAALFHDAGFTKEYAANEIIGVEMSKEILPQFGYSDKQVEIVEGLILATRVPQKPETHLQKIICDADLDYLGRDDFHPIADTLKKELMAFGKITDDKQWDEIQVKFLEAHKYFTDSANVHRAPKKAIHVAEVKQRLAADLYDTRSIKENKQH